MITSYDKKCYYYDQGFCKFKNDCKNFHPTKDCKFNCSIKSTCPKRHRKKCRYGNTCYHHLRNKCEYIHNTSNDLNVTLASKDKEPNEAHKVMLSTGKPTEEKLNEEIEKFKEIIEKQYKEKIERLQEEINN